MRWWMVIGVLVLVSVLTGCDESTNSQQEEVQLTLAKVDASTAFQCECYQQAVDLEQCKNSDILIEETLGSDCFSSLYAEMGVEASAFLQCLQNSSSQLLECLGPDCPEEPERTSRQEGCNAAVVPCSDDASEFGAAYRVCESMALEALANN